MRVCYEVKYTNCAHCGQKFRKNRRMCCSPECTQKMRMASRSINFWTADEDAILDAAVGVEPFPKIIEMVQVFEHLNGLPVRTSAAIKARAEAYFDSVRVTGGSYFTKKFLMSQLSIGQSRLNSWFTGCDALPTEIRSARIWQIARPDFQAWARRNPHRLAGIPAARLNELMDDLKFCTAVEALPQAKHGAKPVRDTHTGELYPSGLAASRRTEFSSGSIYRSACQGLRWEFVPESEFARAIAEQVARATA
jgi:hypothetical protein